LESVSQPEPETEPEDYTFTEWTGYN